MEHLDAVLKRETGSQSSLIAGPAPGPRSWWLVHGQTGGYMATQPNHIQISLPPNVKMVEGDQVVR